MKYAPALLCAVALLPAAASANDLYVNPNRAGAYATVQAAHDAASPGDRILIEVDLPAAGETIITKSVTIESIDDNRRALPYVGDANQPGRFLIDALTPGIPLTLRSLHMSFLRLPGSDRALTGIRANPLMRGKVMMDHMSVDNGAVNQDLATTLMNFDSRLSELWIRNTRFFALDTTAKDGCVRPDDERDGSDTFRCNCRVLIMEDSECFAGSAAFLRFASCSQEGPFGGVGGRAVYATVDATVVVRCLFSDGNGGDVEIARWTVAPVPGPRNPSLYTSAGSLFEAFTSGHEPARDGRLAAAPDPSRLGYNQFGSLNSQLSMGGDCRIGGQVDLTATLTPPDVTVALLSLDWNFIVMPPPLGLFWLDVTKLIGILPFGVTATVPLPVPADTSLLQVPVVAQGILLPNVAFTNPTGVQLRL